MKVKICIDCAGKYLTGQYDPIGEANKRKNKGLFLIKTSVIFAGMPIVHIFSGMEVREEY